MAGKEEDYQSRLRHASLVVEADDSHRDVKRILEAFGARLRRIEEVGGVSWHKASGSTQSTSKPCVGTSAELSVHGDGGNGVAIGNR
jgi:hypothetical protein